LLEARAMTMVIDAAASAPAPRRPLASVSVLRARIPPSLVGLARNRLVQFAALGGLIFALAPRPRSTRDIDVRSERIAALAAVEASRRAGPPRAQDEVEEQQLEDEILYREALRLGLDRNDGIVRARLVQKSLFLAEEIAGASRPPTEAELRAFFERNKERWTIPERYRITQVFSRSPDALSPPAHPDGPPPEGEPGPVPRDYEGTTAQIAERLGAPFVEALAQVPEGVWSGPLRSAFGWHLVRIASHTPARQARFEEVRHSVLEADSLFRRQEAVARFLESGFARYRVTLDGRPVAKINPARRVAYRTAASGED
jgi:peptidyl-prolyl cis-trans isomerase C